jgi:imidazolonepropionase-like amidohydrolase
MQSGSTRGPEPVRCVGRWAAFLILITANAACTFSGASRTPTERAELAVRVGRVLDVRGGRYMGPAVVMINGSRIARVIAADEFHTGSADTLIDVGDLTMVPGLIDAHVHLGIGGTVRANALAQVQAGFTTVADQGARTHRLLALRDSINAGHIDGPRVLAAGIWVGTKGGVCEFSGIGIAGDSTAFIARVRDNVAAGANLTKVCLSSWPAVSHLAPDSVEMPTEVIRAIVAESHSLRRPVTAHAISRGAAQAAVDAGVDGLVHAAYVDGALARAMRERGMWMSPTLASLTAGESTAATRALVDAVRVAHGAGVMLVFGTDGGVLPHGQGVDELEALVGAGLSPLEAIQTATLNAARALGLADSIGTIAAGMSADLVAVRGDPLRDIAVLRQPALVMLRGRVVVGPASAGQR